MDLNDILKTLGVASAAEILAPHWDQSASSLPAELPRFLAPETITQTRELGHLAAEADLELHEAARPAILLGGEARRAELIGHQWRLGGTKSAGKIAGARRVAAIFAPSFVPCFSVISSA